MRWRPVGVVWVGSNPIPSRRIGVRIVAIVASGRRIARWIGRGIVRIIIGIVRRVVPISVRIVGVVRIRVSPIPIRPVPIPSKS